MHFEQPTAAVEFVLNANRSERTPEGGLRTGNYRLAKFGFEPLDRTESCHIGTRKKNCIGFRTVDRHRQSFNRVFRDQIHMTPALLRLEQSYAFIDGDR